MNLLLDTHVLLWWLADDSQLGHDARRAIADDRNIVVVSAATIWEIEIKRALGKLEAPDDLLTTVAESGFEELQILWEDAQVAARLPAHHRDPFDRMLVAQAMRLPASVLTRDPAFAAYEIPLVAP